MTRSAEAERHQLLAALARTIPRIDRRIATMAELSRRFSLIRLGLLIGGTAIVYAAFSLAGDIAGWVSIGLVVATFAIVADRHSRVERSIRRHRIWREIKQGHRARMQHDWANIPVPLPTVAEPDHPFELDLNISGGRSLLHLIDTAISVEGSRRLRAWLLESIPDPVAALNRQQRVRELTPLNTFRDRLTLNGRIVAPKREERWEGERLMEWLRHESGHHAMRPALIILAILAIINVALIALYALDLAPALWPYSFAIYAAFYLFRRGDFAHLFEEAFELDLRLGQLRAILLYLEHFNCRNAPELERLCRIYRQGDARPSVLLRSVSRIASAASFQHNPLARLLLNAAMPWDLYFAFRLEQSKERLLSTLPHWLDTWYELEALCSLANFAHLNPDYTFPEIIAPDSPQPLMNVVAVGHPLIPSSARITNDFRVEHTGDISIVTGSNMSGKSTFLRTLGVNLILANAGGSVCASVFRVAPMRLFTCINVSDSVNDGISYFYAEVRRLKSLLLALQLDHPFPLFFLIDEIFRGTNNRERLIGSRSFVRALAGGHGAGLISTHDLELVQIAEEVSGITNYHFREHVTDGRMVFDYLLRNGPSPTTNALEIMRMEGLPVSEEGRLPIIGNGQ
jgi:hypothetical protein